MKVFIIVRTNSKQEARELLEDMHALIGEQRATLGKKSQSEILIRTDHSWLRKIEKEIDRFYRKKRPKNSPPNLAQLQKIVGKE